MNVGERTMIQEWMGEEGTLILDNRPYPEFAHGFLQGSIWVSGIQYAQTEWLTLLVANSSNLVMIVSEGQHPHSWLQQLCAEAGKIQPMVVSWTKQLADAFSDRLDMVILIEPDELAIDIRFDDHIELADVRTATEFGEGHLAGAKWFSPDEWYDAAKISMLDEHANIYLYCSGNKHSLTAASVLKWHGIHNLRVVDAPWEDISRTPGLTIDKSAEKLN